MFLYTMYRAKFLRNFHVFQGRVLECEICALQKIVHYTNILSVEADLERQTRDILSANVSNLKSANH